MHHKLKPVLLAAVALFLTTPVWAQSPSIDTKSPNYHELPLDLGTKGAMTQHFVVTKIKTADGKTTKGAATSDFELTYTRTDTGYDVTKTLTKFTPGAGLFTGATDAEATQATAMTQKMVMAMSTDSYSADESLTPIRFKDWEGLKTRLGTAMADMMTASGEKITPAQMSQMVNSMYGQLTPESATRVMLEADFLLTIPHNTGLVLNTPLVYDRQVQAPLGGNPLDAHESLTLTQWDPSHNTAHIVYDFAPTPESLGTYMQDFMPKWMAQAGAPESAITEFRAQLKAVKPADLINMTTHCDYDMHIDSGTIVKGTCTKTVAMDIGGEKNGTVQITDFSEAFKK